jgi:hypothetical protein
MNAQNGHVRNPNASPVSLNPSFAGSNGFIRSNISLHGYTHRNTPSINAGISVDAFLKPINGGIAISLCQDGINNYSSDKNI